MAKPRIEQPNATNNNLVLAERGVVGYSLGGIDSTIKTYGHVIFLEPTEDGSFFEAEVLFDACDGDERAEKKAAYSAMMHYEPLRLVAEIPDEVFFNFDSVEDFNLSMGPKKNVEKVSAFLFEHSFQLRAGRRINIFQVV
jgi:hypothetical protein